MQPTKDHSIICVLDILDKFAEQKREAVCSKTANQPARLLRMNRSVTIGIENKER